MLAVKIYQGQKMFSKVTYIICCWGLLMQAGILFSENSSGKPSIKWQAIYDEAAKQSKASSKPLLILFTGSDWCSCCTKLDEESLNTLDFAVVASNKFIFLKLDFPLYTSQDPEIKAQNKQLQAKFDVRSFPTIIIYDAQGDKVIGSTGYRPGGGRQYADYLLKLVNDYASYKQKVALIDHENLSGNELKQLYEYAQKYNQVEDAEKIMVYGLQSDKTHYFLTERYRIYAKNGLLNSPEAVTLKQELLAADPDNEKHIPYQIAMIEFELYSKDLNHNHCCPDVAVSPLTAYLDKYGSQDKENAWRLQMIISQVYLEKNQTSGALKHAQCGYDTAPSSIQPEIAKAIKNFSAK